MSNVPFGFASSGDDSENSPNAPGFDLSALGQMFSQLGAAMSQASTSGPTGWLNTDVAKQFALQAIGHSHPASAVDTDATRQALDVVEVWLDGVTSFPAAARTAVAWSPAEWVEQTLPAWEKLCTPIAERSSTAYLEGLPPEVMAQFGPIGQMMQSMGAMAYGSQLGQALAALSTTVLTSTDLGLILGPPGTAALLPTAIASLATDIGQDADELRLYLAAREAATHRLFAATPWLSGRIAQLVTTYAAEITVDTSALQELAGSMDLSKMAELQEKVAELGATQQQLTPAQQQIRGVLETLLDLIDGWVETVVAQAIDGRIRATGAILEAMRRRRATGGPAEMTFGALAGLEFRPKRQRAASRIWQAIGQERGNAGRDAMWADPNLLPVGADLDDPDAFIAGDQEFAKLLAELDNLDTSALAETGFADDAPNGTTPQGPAAEGPAAGPAPEGRADGTAPDEPSGGGAPK